MIYISTIFDDIKTFPYGSSRKISAFLDLPHFQKLPTNWHSLVLQSRGLAGIISSKKIDAYPTFRFHPVTPGLLELSKENVLGNMMLSH